MLRFIIVLLKVLAWIVLVLGVLGALAALIGSLAGWADVAVRRATGFPVRGVVAGVVTFVVALFFSLLYFISLYASAQLIEVFIDTEANTRASVLWLQYLSQQTASPSVEEAGSVPTPSSHDVPTVPPV
jgi:hypothetical protein